MITACILSPWAQIDEEGTTHNAPQVFVDHPMPLYTHWRDITGTPEVPCEPNLCALQVSTYTDADLQEVAAWLETIDADPSYTILWVEP